MRTIGLMLLVGLGAGGCGESETLDEPEDVRAAQEELCDADLQEARRLFEKETFGGNGRTCRTCHGKGTGTVSPAEAAARFAKNPNDPLFEGDGSDDGLGNGASRMISSATVLVTIPLPPNVKLAGDPSAKSVTVRRGIPSVMNTPALDPVLMYDGREKSLVSQARSAIHGHAQSTIEPTDAELALIAEFERTDEFFSSNTLRFFARGGPAPTLPQGYTPSQKRGRRFFVDAPADPADPKKGICAHCHSGPMLNEVNDFFMPPVAPIKVPKGSRFQTVLVSELNAAKNPVFDFVIKQPDGSTVTRKSPDPGLSLISGNFTPFPMGQLNFFKIPTLWGVKKTAPYFHDGSAKTLEAVVAHYKQFFLIVTDPSRDGDPPIVLTPQDEADLVAYMKLL